MKSRYIERDRQAINGMSYLLMSRLEEHEANMEKLFNLSKEAQKGRRFELTVDGYESMMYHKYRIQIAHIRRCDEADKGILY